MRIHMGTHLQQPEGGGGGSAVKSPSILAFHQ